MALFDSLLNQSARVLLEVRADTSQAKAEIKSLAGEERKAAQARLAQLEAGNKKIEDQSKAWQGAAAKVALVAGSFVLAKKGLDAYAKTGADAAAKVNRITGNVGNALDKVFVGVGKVVVAFAPLIEAASQFVAIIGKAVELVGDLAGELFKTVPATAILDPEYRRLLMEGKIKPGDFQRTAADPGSWSGAYDKSVTWKGAGGGLSDLIAQGVRRGLGIDEWGGKPGSPGKSGPRKWDAHSSRVAKDLTDDLVKRLEAEGDDLYDTSKGISGGYGDITSKMVADATALNRAMNDKATRGQYESFRAGKQQSFLESTFGTLDEFNGYATAFSMLSGSVTSALSAWIDGSMSAGQAIQKFIGEAMKGLAIQMATESIKHGAYAIGSLAFGDVRGAAMHGKAALAFGLGATAAAVAAKGLHSGGGSGPSAGASPAAPQSYGGGSGSSPQPERIIVYGDSFAEETARGKQQRARRMVTRALGNSATEAW